MTGDARDRGIGQADLVDGRHGRLDQLLAADGFHSNLGHRRALPVCG